MGDALQVFRGLPLLTPQNIEPLPTWSSADGTFNNIYCNTIVVANPPGANRIPGLEIVEYDNSTSDFALLEIQSQTNGPFLIQTAGAGGGVSRGISITASQDLILTGQRNAELAAGGLITIQNFTAAQILIDSDADIQLTYATQVGIGTFWTFDNGGQFLPSPAVNSRIGAVGSAFAVQGIHVLTLNFEGTPVTTATTGAASPLPTEPAGYISVVIAGGNHVIPFYNP